MSKYTTKISDFIGRVWRHPTTVAFFVIFLAFTVSGCFPEEETPPPGPIRVGVLPDESEAILIKRYEPLLDHLSAATGLIFELVIPKDYGELLTLFANKEVELAYFGGLTFLQAHRKYQAVPLVMRDTDLKFRSYFLARVGTAPQSLEDFRGMRFAFGSALSTSGHLMPRYFLGQDGIEPERYFSEVTFSGSHDRTALMVRDNLVDLGVANARIIDKMYADGRLDPAEVRIVQETRPYPDYVWALQNNRNATLRNQIVQAFLALGPADKTQANILENIDAGGFLPAQIEDFSELIAIAELRGLL